MAKSVNKIILLGNVGKDPEVRATNGGTLVANISLATAERFKDKAGEWQEQTEWHNLVAYARGAEILRDYVRKGDRLFVEGKHTTRSWDDRDSGKRAYRSKIVVNDITLLPRNDAVNGNGKSSRGKSGDEHTEENATFITDDDLPPF